MHENGHSVDWVCRSREVKHDVRAGHRPQATLRLRGQVLVKLDDAVKVLIFNRGERWEVMWGGVRLSVRRPRRLLLVWFLWGQREETSWCCLTPNSIETIVFVQWMCSLTFDPTRAQLSGCCGRQLCNGLSGCGSGLLTVASRLLAPLNSPPAEPLHCRRGGCGNELEHTNTPSFSFWSNLGCSKTLQ